MRYDGIPFRGASFAAAIFMGLSAACHFEAVSEVKPRRPRRKRDNEMCSLPLSFRYFHFQSGFRSQTGSTTLASKKRLRIQKTVQRRV
ncbi:MAG TPA: hypothetical protein DEB17_09730 [Chlorobaculum sp.]|uniref:Lipoprotein n=1 Tax=Chlorobaculum tepidum (strain ATCC 49652 / DSM 12025 / NBRC 103806 / TLS) TaxID=194439 RepID=Q8KA91_CHLTE|nr:hypothetical protein CT2277 [Chlorobaculum tepidum TLS]HBU24247.1 hypothetical protein [Chlorobaculum sp.]